MSSTRVRPPKPVAEAIARIERSSWLNEGIVALQERRNEFSSPMAAKLAGIALMPESRDSLEDSFERMWARNELYLPVGRQGEFKSKSVPEVVIGAGLHAAIYCAARVKMGHPRPLVIERGGPDEVGGAFAMTRQPTFFLNSRNRPGKIGVPGRGEALNALPAAPIQPSDLSGDEFQRNSDLAFAIRVTLAMYARVVPYCEARTHLGTYLETSRGPLYADRYVYAIGLGRPNLPDSSTSEKSGYDGKMVMTVVDFMRHMARERFPLRGLNRVAVIGAGDSGKTVVEALTGKGPSTKWSSCGLDYVERIDWYGCANTATSRAGWEQCPRARYRNLGVLFPLDTNGGDARIRPLANATRVQYGFESAYVDGVPYDLVVYCGGFTRDAAIDRLVKGDNFAYGRRNVACKNLSYPIYGIGPTARLPVPSRVENAEYKAVQAAKENETALFRYADRTAAFALAMD